MTRPTWDDAWKIADKLDDEQFEIAIELTRHGEVVLEIEDGREIVLTIRDKS